MVALLNVILITVLNNLKKAKKQFNLRFSALKETQILKKRKNKKKGYCSVQVSNLLFSNFLILRTMSYPPKMDDRNREELV